MLTQIRSRHLLAFCCFLLFGCTPGFTPVQWDALDYDDLSERINNPTGAVSLENIDQVSSEIILVHASASSFDQTLTRAVSTLEGDSSSRESGLIGTKHGGLDGTNVYLKLACPGADLSNPSTDLSEGFVRIDSPNLSENSLLTGGLLVEFNNCTVGDLFMDGVCVAHYNASPFSFGLNLHLFVSYEEFELTTAVEMIYDNDKFQALLTLNDETTLTVEANFSSGLESFSVTGANGSFACEQSDDGSIQCVDETAGETTTIPM